jgi:hypothetical protein
MYIHAQNPRKTPIGPKAKPQMGNRKNDITNAKTLYGFNEDHLASKS